MPRSILYFPYIEIKDSVWLRNAILYWDEVCSIVPHANYQTNSLEIDYLREYEMYRPIYPQMLFDSRLYQDFSREFINCFKNYKINRYSKLKCRTNATSNGIRNYTDIHVAKLLPELETSVHYKKIPYELYNFMEKSHVLERTDGNEWASIEQNVAELYMSILAKYLSETDNRGHMVIGTDTKRHIDTAFPRTYYGKLASSKHFCFTVALENALPVPNLDIPLEDVIRFKQQRQQELFQIREKLRNFENQISTCETMNQMQGVICDFKELWQKELLGLDKMMKDNRISYFMGCMKSLVTASIPGIATALSTYLGGRIPPWIAVASLGLVGSIGIGANSVKYRKEQYQALHKSDFLYLYQAKKQGLVNVSSETIQL